MAGFLESDRWMQHGGRPLGTGPAVNLGKDRCAGRETQRSIAEAFVAATQLKENPGRVDWPLEQVIADDLAARVVIWHASYAEVHRDNVRAVLKAASIPGATSSSTAPPPLSSGVNSA